MNCFHRDARGPHRLAARALLGALLLAGAPPLLARATLGEAAATVEADRARLQGRVVSSSVQTRFVVHEVENPTGTIREYARPDGVIFAVTWTGVTVPELDPLLGRFAADFRAAQPGPAARSGRRSARVSGAEVVVETWGHMRAYRGRAWVPALLPAGVVADELE